MNKIILFTLTALLLTLSACKTIQKDIDNVPESSTDVPVKPEINETFLTQYISKTTRKIILDGAGSEADWSKSVWRPMDQLMVGTMPSAEDFQGRYKLLWDEDMLYLLAEIQDDNFMDIHPDGLNKYWDDDCLEIFVDEDKTGGDHQYNYNAFAYHLSLDDQVVDIGYDRKPAYFNDHIEISKERAGNMMTWEVGIKLYAESYTQTDTEASRVILSTKKKIGFMVAYCDNDQSKEREHFMGDMFIQGEEKNTGWKNASVFGQLILKE